jgi:hypothetical protein
LLRFESLTVGRKFPATPFLVGPELVDAYVEVTGDDDPAYRGPSGILPPGLAGVWSRLAYANDYRLPAGGFMASQDLYLVGTARVGEALLLSAEVTALGDVERRELTLECQACDASGAPVGGSRIAARWGATP